MTDFKYNPTVPDNDSISDNSGMLDDKYAMFKRSLLMRIMAIAATLTALFATLDVVGLHDMGNTQRYFNYGFSFFNFAIVILLYKKTIPFFVACSFFLLLCYIGSISAVISVVEDDFRAIWFFLSIFFAFMLGGVTTGYVLTAIVVVTLISLQLLLKDSYDQLSFMSIIIGFTFFSMSLSAFAKQTEKFRNQLRKQSLELHYLANKDPLTDVLNSKNHYELAKTLLEKAKKENSELSMLCVFIDNLEVINQKFGEQTLVLLLEHVEKIMNSHVGTKGDIAKVSPQEYCILLPEFDLLSAKALAGNITASIHKNLFSTDTAKVPVTLSIGASSLLESDNAIRSLQVRADKALNKAKAHGGGTIFTHLD